MPLAWKRLAATWLLATASFAQQGLASRPESRPESAPADPVAAILKEYDDAMKAFNAAHAAADSDAARQTVIDEQYPKAEAWFPRMLEVARANAKQPVALRALLWIVEQDVDAAEGREALTALGRDHAGAAELTAACDALTYAIGRESEDFLRAAARSSPHVEVRARATYALAHLLRHEANLAARLAGDADPEEKALVEKWYGAERTAFLGRLDPKTRAAEAEALFVQVKEKHADVEGPWGGSLGERADRDLFEIRNLAIGKVAPEIEGEDLSGKPLRLSDFRGKVVVLDFWGHW
jgi:hypothetical protein